MRPPTRLPTLALFVLLLLVPGATAQEPTPPPRPQPSPQPPRPTPTPVIPNSARAQIAQGRTLLRRGKADSAYILFSMARDRAEATGDSLALTAAYLGLGLVREEWADSVSEARDYDSYTMAITTGKAGKYSAAVESFSKLAADAGLLSARAEVLDLAARIEGPGQSYYMLDAGDAYLEADQPDVAMNRFQRALRTDPNNVAAVAALSETAFDQGDYRRVLSAARLSKDGESSTRAYANRTLVDLLGREGPSNDERDAALILLTSTLADLRTGPPEFDRDYRRELEGATKRRPHRGIDGLLWNYAAPPPEPVAPRWWRSELRRRQTWHRLMRRLGEWYDLRGDLLVARPYYEAALGYPNTEIIDPSVDIEALVPLAAIYAELEPFEFEQFSQWLFNEKMLAYQMLRSERPEAIPMLRALHLSLGLMFASQRRWGTDAGDPYGATFQLERMWDFTNRMREEGAQVVAPPEALEQLAYAYFAHGMEADARRAAEAALRGYTDRGDEAEARRFSETLEDPAKLAEVIGG